MRIACERNHAQMRTNDVLQRLCSLVTRDRRAGLESLILGGPVHTNEA